MRKLFILTFCVALCACAGTRTIDGETTKNWVKIVSSRTDNSGNVKDVCFILNLSFYPGSAYDRVKNNPNSCLEQCCWYSENKTVDFYFNDGFTKDLEEYGVSRRYYPDHISIKMNYASFVNRLSARATSADAISTDGVIKLDFEDVVKAEEILNEDFSKYQAKVYTDADAVRGSELKHTDKVITDYKTVSMSGINRDELLAQAKAEEAKDLAHAQEIAAIYSNVSKGEEIKPSSDFDMQVSPFDAEHRALDKSMKEEKKAKIKAAKEAAKAEQAAKEKALQEEKEAKAKEAAQFQATQTAKVKAAKANANQAIEDVKNGTAVPVVKSSPATNNQGISKDSSKSVSAVPVVAVKKSSKNSKAKNEPIYDVQKPASQDNKVEAAKPVKNENINILQKKLEYERQQAVFLLKRFYGSEIDSYLRFLDKAKKQEGQVLMTNDKVWQTKKVGTPIYMIDCKVNGKIALLGAEADTPTTDYPIACGTYVVDLDEKTVEAKDALARKIVKKNY